MVVHHFYGRDRVCTEFTDGKSRPFPCYFTTERKVSSAPVRERDVTDGLKERYMPATDLRKFQDKVVEFHFPEFYIGPDRPIDTVLDIQENIRAVATDILDIFVLHQGVNPAVPEILSLEHKEHSLFLVFCQPEPEYVDQGIKPFPEIFSPPVTFNNLQICTHQFLKCLFDNIKGDLFIFRELWLYDRINEGSLLFIVLDMHVPGTEDRSYR